MGATSLTYTCGSCNTVNRVLDPKLTGGKWNCGRCGNTVLHKEKLFHDNIITEVRVQLEAMLDSLREIRYPVFAQKRMSEIEKMNTKFRSKIENWENHLAYLKSDDDRATIRRSYKPDLDILESLTASIHNEVQDSRWFKDKIKGADFVRKILVSTSITMQAIAKVLSYFGLDGLLNAVLEFAKFVALEYQGQEAIE